MAFEFDFNEMFSACALYLSKGLRVVRLHGIRPDGRCTCGDDECRVGGSKQRNCGKHPVGNNWGNRWARSEDDLLEWDDGVPFNVGVILGADAGVIDNEDDSPEATAFRESLGLQHLVTPSYTSGKSVHQLTRWHDSLTSCQGVVKPGGLECRTGAGKRQIQSVLPPSWHNTGVRYQWKPGLSIDDIDIAETPKILLMQIVNGGPRGDSSGGSSESFEPLVFREVHDGQGRHRALLVWSWRNILADRFPLSKERRPELTQILLDANEKHLKPPKTKDEALKIINSCFEYYRRKLESGWNPSPDDLKPESVDREVDQVEKVVKPEDAVSVTGLEAHGLEPYAVGSVRGYRVGSWYIEMTKGDPPEIVLCVPAWGNTPCRGKVRMSLDTFRSAAKVAGTVFTATRRVILDGDSKRWNAVWKGIDASQRTNNVAVPGLMEQLMSRKTAEFDIEVGTSSLRYAALAGYLLQVFKKASKPRDEEKPEPNESGRPCWVRPNELWFQWIKAWEDIGRMHDVGPGESRDLRARLIQRVGVKDFEHRRHRFASHRMEYIVFTKPWIDALESLAAGEDGQDGQLPDGDQQADGDWTVKGDADKVFSETENPAPSTVHSI